MLLLLFVDDDGEQQNKDLNSRPFDYWHWL